MRKILMTATTLLTLATAAHAAGEAVAVGDLPKPVQATVQDYFPGASIRSAERVVKPGRAEEYELGLTYKAIPLEVELNAAGHVLDVEMKKH